MTGLSGAHEPEAWLAPLADWAAGGGAETAAGTGALRARAALAVLDWFCAYYAGFAHPAAPRYCAVAAQDADPGGGLAPSAEGWLAGALSHLEEIDDGHRLAMLHPGVVTLPAVLALGRRRRLRVGQVLAAIVAGYELSVRVGAALGPAHYKAHHSTATAGSFGAAAAAGVCLGLAPERMLWALAHAGTQAAGLWQFLDDGASEAKAAHVGQAVRNGLSAGWMAHHGLCGAARILEGRRGLAAALGLSIDRQHLAIPQNPGDSALATATIKAWPVCGQIHHVLDAVLSLIAKEPGGFAPARIAAVEIRSYAATRDVAGITAPRDLGELRFSTVWCTAMLLRDGSLGFDALHPGLIEDSALTDLAARVTLVADPELTADFPARRRCAIQITLSDGSTRACTWEGRRGDPEHPLSMAEIETRFEGVASHMPTARRAGVRALVTQLGGDAPLDAPLGGDTLTPLFDPAALAREIGVFSFQEPV